MFKTCVDRSHNLIEVTLSGMMSVEEVGRYTADLKRQFIAHGLTSYAMVIDIAACPIQHQDVVRSLGEHMAAMPKARSIAIVTGGSLARMQVRRLFTQPYARICSTVAEGRRWVLQGVEPLAA